MLFIIVIAVGIAVGYVASLRKTRFRRVAYVSVAILGAFVGAFLSFGDSPLFLKYSFLNIFTVPVFFSVAFALMTMFIDRAVNIRGI